MALTDSKIKYLKPKKERYIQWEGATGFGVRVAPSGRKTFILMYRFGGTARMMSIGIYPAMSLAEARTKAALAKENITKGVDPARELIHSRRADRESATVADLAEEYLDKWARPRKRSAREDERILRKDVLPVLGNWKAKSVARRDIVALLDNIVARGAPIQANRTLAVLQMMFKYAAGRDKVPASPCAAISKPAPENKRKRFLSEKEVRMFWHGLTKASMTEASRLALKLLLVTGQRKGELLKASWSEIEFDSNVWTIPEEHSKNKHPHRVLLSPMALDLLTAVKTESGDSPLLFPSPRDKLKPMGVTSMDHALRRNLGVLEMKDFTPHDLRRTFATLVKYPGEHRKSFIKKVLNHREKTATDTYDLYEYDDDKRKMLNAWSRQLQAMIGQAGGGAVELKSLRKRI
ncbi:MAG: integrase arm-type DNA-binding domain-containing protein [Nitrospinae bacterium]|nr:integrase arm-type DNA-binding domain-containing protein [Nitrospinota bacterium]